MLIQVKSFNRLFNVAYTKQVAGSILILLGFFVVIKYLSEEKEIPKPPTPENHWGEVFIIFAFLLSVVAVINAIIVIRNKSFKTKYNDLSPAQSFAPILIIFGLVILYKII